MTFAREAWPFVLPFVALAAGCHLAGRHGWALTLWLIALCVLLFFRNPSRRFDGDETVVLAAADGHITRIDEGEAPAVGPGRYHHVVTFLSVFSVHVQRAPVTGEVVVSRYTPGRKVAAFREDAGDVNENHLTVIRKANGDLIGVRQIAGLLARRVVAYPRVGDRLERGQLIGLIKFGSRVDLYFPVGYRSLGTVGDAVRNGLTPLGDAPQDR